MSEPTNESQAPQPSDSGPRGNTKAVLVATGKVALVVLGWLLGLLTYYITVGFVEQPALSIEVIDVRHELTPDATILLTDYDEFDFLRPFLPSYLALAGAPNSSLVHNVLVDVDRSRGAVIGAVGVPEASNRLRVEDVDELIDMADVSDRSLAELKKDLEAGRTLADRLASQLDTRFATAVVPKDAAVRLRALMSDSARPTDTELLEVLEILRSSEDVALVISALDATRLREQGTSTAPAIEAIAEPNHPAWDQSLLALDQRRKNVELARDRLSRIHEQLLETDTVVKVTLRATTAPRLANEP